MRFDVPSTIQQLLSASPEAILHGNASTVVTGISQVSSAESGDLVFASTAEWLERAFESEASAIVTTSDLLSACRRERHSRALVLHPRPFAVYASLVRNRFADWGLGGGPQAGKIWAIPGSCRVAGTAFVHPTASLGNNCVVMDGVHVGGGVTIGSDTFLDVNSAIGTRPFYYETGPNGEVEPYPACGSVAIGDRVYVGSGTTIARGVTEITRVGNDSKIDNLVQVGHGVVIGERVLIAAQTGIGGEATIGDDVYIQGQVGIAPHVSIPSGSIIYGRALVSKSFQSAGHFAGQRAVTRDLEARRQAVLSLLAPFSGALRRMLRGINLDNVELRIKAVIAENAKVDPATLSGATRLGIDAPMDSLEMIEVVMALEDEFTIDIDEAIIGVGVSVSDVVLHVTGLIASKGIRGSRRG